MGFIWLLLGAETVFCMEDRSLHGITGHSYMDLPLVGRGADGNFLWN